MPVALKLEAVTADDFAPHLGSAFELFSDNGQDLVLTLFEIHKLGRECTSGRQPFSLSFTAPSDGPILPQGIYQINHAELNAFDLFIVPISANADRICYEAVFN